MPKKKTPAKSAPVANPQPPADTPAFPPSTLTVLAQLDSESGMTAAEVVESSGLGRSTVTKALSTLHDAGLAVRQDGGFDGTRRIADHWFAAPGGATPAAATETEAAADADDLAEPAALVDGTSDDSLAEAVSEVGPDDAAEEPSALAPPEAEKSGDDIGEDAPLNVQPEEASDPEPDTVSETAEKAEDASGDRAPEEVRAQEEPAVADESGGPGLDESDETRPEYQDSADDSAAGHAHEATDQAEPARGVASGCGSSADPQPENADQGAGELDLDADDAASASGATAGKASGPRLGKGELKAQVEAHMRAHPDRSFTSTELHHLLNKSSGAIANACEKLVEEGKLFVAQEKKPRRFQWNTAVSQAV